MTATLLRNVDLSPFKSLGKGITPSYLTSPDGKLILKYGSGTLSWYESATMKPLGSVPMEDVSDIQFSPDGKKIAVQGFFNAQVVDLQTQQVSENRFGYGGLRDFYFTPDSRYILFRSDSGTIRFTYYLIARWNVAKEAVDVAYPGIEDADPNAELGQQLDWMSVPAISPDGKLVAAGGDISVFIWDFATGKILHRMEGHGSDVTCAAFSPSGKLLASGSADGTVRLWDTETGEPINIITGFTDNVIGISFTKEGRYLKITVAGQRPKFWDLQVGRFDAREEPVSTPTPDPQRLDLHHQGYLDAAWTSNVLFSPDGKMMALGGRNVLLWEPEQGRLLQAIENRHDDITGMAFSPDSRYLAATTHDGSVLVWNTQTGETLLDLSSSAPEGAGPTIGAGVMAAQGLAFSPDSSRLAFGNKNAVEIWTIPDGKKIREIALEKKDQFASTVSFASSGRELAVSINFNQNVQIWDAETGQKLRDLNLPKPDMNAFSASDLRWPYFARNNYDQSEYWIELWNLESSQMLKLATPARETEPLCLSQDGHLLLAVSDSHVFFWRTDTGQLTYRSPEKRRSGSYSFSPDSKTLAIESGGQAQMVNIAAIAQAARQPDMAAFVPPTPTAAPTREPSRQETPTPFPTFQLTPQPLPALAQAAIVPENAAQISQQWRFGFGVIGQVGWAVDGRSYFIAGSRGTYHFTEPITSLEPTGWVTSAALLKDGSMEAAAEDEDSVKVWRGAEKSPLFNQPGRQPILSPDGKRLAYGVDGDTLKVVNLENGQELATLECSLQYWRRICYDHLTFSPDGKYLAAARPDKSIRIWEVDTGRIAFGLGGPSWNSERYYARDGNEKGGEGRSREITQIAFSPDGSFVTAAAGNSAWVWNLRTGAPPQQIRLFDSPPFYMEPDTPPLPPVVTAAALNPQNRILAVGTSQREILLIDRPSQAIIRRLTGHNSPIVQLAFSPDGARLLSTDRDGTLSVWAIPQGTKLEQKNLFTGAPRGLTFTQDGNLRVWTDNIVWTLDPKEGKPVQQVAIPTGTIFSASPSGEQLAVYDPFHIQLWDASERSSATGTLQQTVEGETGFIILTGNMREDNAAFFSQDGKKLAVVGTGGTRLFDVASGKLLQEIPGGNPFWAAFSPDRKRLLACEDYENGCWPKIMDMNTGNEIQTPEKLEGYNFFVQSVFAPDGLSVLSAANAWEGISHLVKWDTFSGKILHALEFGDGEQILSSLAVSPDGKIIAVGQTDGQFNLVNGETFQVITTRKGHPGKILFMAFSPDGRYLATAGEDGTVLVWAIR